MEKGENDREKKVKGHLNNKSVWFAYYLRQGYSHYTNIFIFTTTQWMGNFGAACMIPDMGDGHNTPINITSTRIDNKRQVAITRSLLSS